MPVPRRQIVDVNVTPYYHCLSRCVRKAYLCGEGYEHRKEWIERRLEVLAGAFALSVCGYSVMDNHLHVLVRLEPDRSESWSDHEVARRWLAVYPPRDLDLEDSKAVSSWVSVQVSFPRRIATWRERLADLGWFMKALKEPLARWANEEDGCSGAFWEGRYKSIAILDEEALLTTCIYIDLNPLAAGQASTPEGSRYTSLCARLSGAREQGKLADLKGAREPNSANRRLCAGIERGIWLCPIDQDVARGPDCPGMLAGLSLAGYLSMVDYSSRLHRTGKSRMNPAVADIFERLGTSENVWKQRFDRLFSRDRHRGHYFGTQRSALQKLAESKRQRHVSNLDGCPA